MILTLIIVLYSMASIGVACRAGSILAWSWARDQALRYPSLYATNYRYGHTSKLNKDNVEYNPPSSEQWFGGIMLGLGIGIIWPITALAFVARKQLFVPPKDIANRLKAKENALLLERQREEIEELDRQLEEGKRGSRRSR